MSVYGNLFLLDGLEKNDKENIIRSLPDTVKFKKGEPIYSRKRFFGALGFIVCGSVKAVTNNDRRLVMKELCGGNCFGAAAVFGGGDTYVSTLTAQSDTEVCFIPESLLILLFKEYPQTAVNYITFLSDKIRFLNEKLSVISCSDAEDTVLNYLKLSANENGYAEIPVSMTELSKMLGLSRASLYRSIDALEANGNIKRENNGIKVIKK